MTTVKTLIEWLEKLDDHTEVDVVKFNGIGDSVDAMYEPIVLSFEKGNVHLGLDGDTPYVRLGEII